MSEWINDEVIACVFDYGDPEVAAVKCGVSVEVARKILNEYAEPYDWGDECE